MSARSRAVVAGFEGQVFNVFFSKSDMESGRRMAAARHVDRLAAVDLCERRAKSAAANPSTVKFSRLMDLAVQEHPNGRTRLDSSFTAKNAFGVEQKFHISCLLDASGLIEATVTDERGAAAATR